MRAPCNPYFSDIVHRIGHMKFKFSTSIENYDFVHELIEQIAWEMGKNFDRKINSSQLQKYSRFSQCWNTLKHMVHHAHSWIEHLLSTCSFGMMNSQKCKLYFMILQFGNRFYRFHWNHESSSLYRQPIQLDLSWFGIHIHIFTHSQNQFINCITPFLKERYIMYMILLIGPRA